MKTLTDNNLPKYEVYKNSGVEWLGEVPEHWEVRKFKNVVSYANRGATPKYVEDSKFKVINQATFSKGCFDLDGTKSTSEKDIAKNNFFKANVKKNDVLLASTGGGVLGKVAHFDFNYQNYFADSHVTIIRTRHKETAKFIYYFLSINFQLINSILAQGSTNQTELQKSWLDNLLITLPALKEQTLIARFLDSKTAVINKAISIKEKQIELLKERRQILIHQAVTRGLNPDVKMKDSGVEWIGEVPEGWEVKALKYVAFLQSGETISPDRFIEGEDCGYPVYGGNGFRGYTDNYTNDGEFALIGRQGALCGNVNYARGKFYASEHAIVVYPLENENVIWLGEAIKLADFNRLSQSAAQPGIAISVVKNVLFPYPQNQEQIEIANYITIQTEKFKAAISLKEKEIEKLKEYKASLINSAVTGKIKVS